LASADQLVQILELASGGIHSTVAFHRKGHQLHAAVLAHRLVLVRSRLSAGVRNVHGAAMAGMAMVLGAVA